MPSAKKLRIEFLKGSIVKIRLHNFLTFDDVELHPGAGLNVIVGPNGTGKSSVVCGICLGLAGHPKLLGRAKELKDFVKYSKSKAFVEIELFNPTGRNPIIRRDITRDNNSSLWILNGKTSKLAEVQKVVSDMNVKLSNKCQFLPQDMVVEFVRMNSYQVLEETEKAVGSPEMYELHQRLKNLKTSHKDIYSLLKEKEESLEKKIRDNELIQNDVERLRERELALKCITILKEKKCWMLYEDARSRYLEQKKNKTKAETRWKKAEQCYKPMENQLKQKENAIAICKQAEQICRKKVTDKQRELDGKRDVLNRLEDEADAPRDELENKKRQERKRLANLTGTRAEMADFEHQLAELENDTGIKAQLAEKQERLKAISRQLNEIQLQQQQINEQKSGDEDQRYRLNGELSRIRDMANRRLQVLRSENQQCYNVVEWLHTHQDCFQRPIIEPMILVAKCRDQQYLTQIESFLNNKDKYSFIAQTRDDMKKLRQEVREKLNISINIVLDPKALDSSMDLSRFTPFADIDDLRHYGFDNWMMNLIDAPAPTLRVLCKFHYLHMVLVAGNMSPEQTTNVVDKIGHQARDFFTSSEHIKVFISSYGNRDRSTKKNFLQKPVYLGSNVDENRVQQIQHEIEEVERKLSAHDKPLKELAQQEKNLRKDDETIRQEKTDLLNRRREKTKLQGAINVRKNRIAELEGSGIDLEVAEEQCKQALLKAQKKRLDCYKKMALLVKQMAVLQKECISTFLDYQMAVMEKEELQKKSADLKEHLENALAQLNEAKRLADESRDKAKHVLKDAQQISGVTSPNDISSDKQEQYDSYPNDLEEIEEKIHEYQAKADLCYNLDNGLIAQFERRREEIENLEQEVQTLQEEYRGHNNEVDELKTKWLGPLKELIAQVDEKFSSFFSSMNCAGEVSLQEDKDNDFSKYGIAIKVKFRPNEDLQLLSANRQSGGERSVSTMLYLMALQGITSCPFRAVDEINQGMDPINERRVFNLIASTVNQAHNSQYFLLTPKLLSGLNYSASVKVHCISNGVEMAPFLSWQIQNFLDTASSMYEDEDNEQ